VSPEVLRAGGLWIALYEGPYHADPRDPGGATAYGIAKRYHPDLTDAQLRAFTPQTAADFLIANYWPKGSGVDALPDCLTTALLAFSVLEGPVQAVRALQRAVGVKVDDDLGPATAGAATSMQPKALLVAFYRECMRRLRDHSPNWLLDGLGWECRQLAASLEGMSSC
jgi:lysozyme family protein